MVILLPLLRRLSVHTRLIVGLTVTCAGLVLLVVAAVVSAGLFIHGIVAALVGVVFLLSAWRDHRRGRLAARPADTVNVDSF